MCGFAGFFASNKWCTAETLINMASTLEHRGPDDQGIWLDKETGVGLAHRRLAIIDLSPEGHQPMVSGCGRYIIVYNG